LVKNVIGMIGYVAYKIDKNNKEKQKDEMYIRLLK